MFSMTHRKLPPQTAKTDALFITYLIRQALKRTAFRLVGYILFVLATPSMFTYVIPAKYQLSFLHQVPKSCRSLSTKMFPVFLQCQLHINLRVPILYPSPHEDSSRHLPAPRPYPPRGLLFQFCVLFLVSVNALAKSTFLLLSLDFSVWSVMYLFLSKQLEGSFSSPWSPPSTGELSLPLFPGKSVVVGP